MKMFAWLIGAFVLAGSLNYVVANDDDTLELLQIVVRHGNRTACSTFDKFKPWYTKTFEPFQLGDITPQGRRQAYQTGQYIRQRYDSFLPEEFAYTDISVKCTAMPRIQESSAVIMTAMFPPKDKQRWQDSGLGSLLTPIPCEYVPSDQDVVMEPDSTTCSRYTQLRNAWYSTPSYLAAYNKLTGNGTLQKYLQECLNMTDVDLTPSDVAVVYDNLQGIDSNGLQLPDWARLVYPEPLTSIMALDFGQVYRSTELIRFAAGELMKEILGVATLLEKGELIPKSRKMFAYIGHDNTILPLLVALGLESLPPVVSYGAAFIMELHRNKTTSEIGYKFVYRNSTWADPVHYIVPGCQEICPLSYVKKLLKPYIPTKPFFDYC